MLAAAEAGELPGDDAPDPERLRDVRPARVADHHHGRRARVPRAEAGVDGGPRQPDRRVVVLPRHAARAVRGGVRPGVVHPPRRARGPPRRRPLRRASSSACSTTGRTPRWRSSSCSAPGRSTSCRPSSRRIGARRAMLVTTAGRLASPDGERVVRLLGRNLETTFAEVESHVPVPLVQQAVLQARRDAVDVVVSFGGGSCADLGKAVCFFLEQEAGMPGATHLDRPVLPHVSIPTTYSGRRAHAVLRHDRSRHPAEAGRRRPHLGARRRRSTTPTSPRPRRRGCWPRPGMNALAHCVEAAYSPHRTPEAEAIALAGARTIHSALPAVVADPGNAAGPHRHARGRRPGRPLPAQRRHGRAPRPRRSSSAGAPASRTAWPTPSSSPTRSPSTPRRCPTRSAGSRRRSAPRRPAPSTPCARGSASRAGCPRSAWTRPTSRPSPACRSRTPTSAATPGPCPRTTRWAILQAAY